MQNLMPQVNTPDNLFHDGDESTGVEGTILYSEFMNNNQSAIRDLQLEVINVLTQAEILPAPTEHSQLLQAINEIVTNGVTSGIKDGSTTQKGIVQLSNATDSNDEAMAATPKAVKAAFDKASNADNAIPVGVPFPWPTNTPPAGFAIVQGQTFATAQYPKLALAYPSGVLPDMRSQTIKGKPDGRDPLTREAGEVKSHAHAATVSATDLGTKNTSSFDYGTKTTTSNAGHDHISGVRTDGGKGGYGDGEVTNGSRVEGTSAKGTASPKTSPVQDHAHGVVIGPHAHPIVMGPHSHPATISPTGNAQNTVDNIAFNYIVRLA